ncbi:MAG: S41 family peptidase [Acidobacteriota bacterium]|nr:S41 family peptidase [Acidobacteriota bacterium]
MNSRSKFAVVMSSTCLVLVLLLGTVLSKGAPAETPGTGIYRHLAVYTEVLSRIKSEYVEEPDMKSVTQGALTGMLESIDPFASYLNAQQYKEYLKDFDSHRGDIGVVLAKKYGYMTVVGVVPGSPAAKSGFSTGDMIESIKGVATRDMPLAYASLLLRGTPGSPIDLTVLRRKPEPQKMTVTRAVIAYPAVTAKMLDNQVGYIKPETLADGKVKEVAAAVEALRKKNATKLVLDLRNCAVGNPEDGIELANLFLDKGLIGYVKGQRYARKDFNAEAQKDIFKLPLVVITNRGTAQAAEVAAAALQQDKRAKIVGEHTYGDASIRQAVTMDDGGAIILSVAKYYGPDGKAIQDIGVTPDTPMVEADNQIELDEEGEPVGKDEASTKPAEDLLLKKAIELVSGVTTA